MIEKLRPRFSPLRQQVSPCYGGHAVSAD
jgi:hypothetical protein